MNKSPQPHLAYILDTIATIRTYTPKSRESFLNDPNAQDATLMRLQDIGEQLVHIRDQFPLFWESFHTEDWPKVIGLRNIISHGYREIEFEEIWILLQGELDVFTVSVEKAYSHISAR